MIYKEPFRWGGIIKVCTTEMSTEVGLTLIRYDVLIKLKEFLLGIPNLCGVSAHEIV